MLDPTVNLQDSLQCMPFNFGPDYSIGGKKRQYRRIDEISYFHNLHP